jgi:hypothetical protein
MRGGGRRGKDVVDWTGGVSGSEGVSGEESAGDDKEDAGEEYIAAVGLKVQNGARLIVAKCDPDDYGDRAAI